MTHPPRKRLSRSAVRVERIVLKTLSKNPDERFQSAAHLKHALQKYLQHVDGAQQMREEETVEGEDEWLSERTPRKDFQARLIGRQTEMKILRGCVDHLKENQGKTIFVAGEAGIGKTRLIEEIEKYANRKGILILKGHCLYQEGLEPFIPFVEAVNEFFQVKKEHPSTRRGRIKDFIRQEAPELMALSQRFVTTIGFSADESEDESSTGYDGGNKTRLFEVLSQLLQLISEKEPLILFLEDIHWADSSSLQLLHYVSRNSRNLPLLIITTYRPEDVSPDDEGKAHPLTDTMQRMNREGLFDRVDLERLSQTGQSKLIKSLLRRIDFSRHFQDLLYKETKGNPFFLIETLKLLQERNIVGPEKGVWRELKAVSGMDIPERVYDVVRSRVERLDDDQREMLQFAAVAGERFSSHLLSHGLEMKKIHLLKILHRLERVHQVIFSEGNMYVFHHPKIREVLYNEIQDELRVEYHRMIGDFLEDEHRDNPQIVLNDLAHHFYHGHNFEKAISYLVNVGDRAAKLYAHKEACEHYERALVSLDKTDTIPDRDGLRRQVLLKAGISYDELGQWEEALEKFGKLLTISQRDGEVKDQAEALRQMGRTYYGKRELDKAKDLYLESLGYYEKIEDWKKICKVYNNIGILFYEKGDLNESVLKYKKALEFAERIGDKEETGNIYTNLGVLHNVKGEWDKALSYYHRCIPLYEDTGDKQGLARVYHNMGMTYADQTAWQISDSYYEQCLELCEDLKDIALLSLTHLNRTEVLLNISDLGEAKESCVMALAHFEKLGDHLGAADAYRFLGVISKREKDWGAAKAHFEESIRLNDQLENPLGLAEVYREYGHLHEERGEVKEALTKLQKAEDLFRRLDAKEDAKEIHQKITKLEFEITEKQKVYSTGIRSQ